MGIDRDAAGRAFAALMLSDGMACCTNKIRGYNTTKMSQKRDDNCAKKHHGMHKIAPFFQKFSRTAPPFSKAEF